MIIDIRDDGMTVVTFENVEEHAAVIAGLDDDRNHPARSALYVGLIHGRAAHVLRRRSVYAFADVTSEAFARGA